MHVDEVFHLLRRTRNYKHSSTLLPAAGMKTDGADSFRLERLYNLLLLIVCELHSAS